MWALRQAIKYLPRVAKNSDDKEAKRQMLYVHILINELTLHTFLFLDSRPHLRESVLVMQACTYVME